MKIEEKRAKLRAAAAEYVDAKRKHAETMNGRGGDPAATFAALRVAGEKLRDAALNYTPRANAVEYAFRSIARAQRWKDGAEAVADAILLKLDSYQEGRL